MKEHQEVLEVLEQVLKGLWEVCLGELVEALEVPEQVASPVLQAVARAAHEEGWDGMACKVALDDMAW